LNEKQVLINATEGLPNATIRKVYRTCMNQLLIFALITTAFASISLLLLINS